MSAQTLLVWIKFHIFQTFFFFFRFVFLNEAKNIFYCQSRFLLLFLLFYVVLILRSIVLNVNIKQAQR